MHIQSTVPFGDLHAQLMSLRQRLPDLTGSILASADGLLITHDLPITLEPTGIAALVATELSLSQRVISTTFGTELHEVVIGGSGGHVAIYAAGPTAALAVVARTGANIGRIHLEARPLANVIAELIDAPATAAAR